MYGIDKLKIVAIFAITFGESFAEKFADKKLRPWEIVQLVMNLKPLPEIIKMRAEIWRQWKDIDEAEIKELSELVAIELELPNNPQLEAKIEKAVPTGLTILDWIDDFLIKEDPEAEAA
jgi:hypothetical protein